MFFCYLIIAFIVGLVIGSFLNVVIYRLPIMMEKSWQKEARQLLEIPMEDTTPVNLCQPASTCPHCHQAIKPYQNIPVLSFLWQRGKCAYCHEPISLRYPLVELLTGLAFMAVLWKFNATPIAIMGLILTAALITLFFIDMDTQLLPDQITLPLVWLGILFNMYFHFITLEQSILGAVVGYLFLWILFHIFKILTGKEGMGYGDFKLLSALGAWLGVSTLPIIFFMAAIIGIITFIILKFSRNQPIAFGPALAISGWVVFMAHSNIMTLVYWWLNISGLNT